MIDKWRDQTEEAKEFRRVYQREWARKYRLESPEGAKDRYRKAQARWKAKHPEYRRKRYRSYSLRKYGMSTSDYDTLVEKQHGCCAICQIPFIPTRTSQKLSVDHDHRTKLVRGLLCHGCNIGLGAFKDDIQKLKNAIVYLSRQIEANLDR